MPSFFLRKAPRKHAFWVVASDTGKKFSKDPLPEESAKAQQRALYASYGSVPVKRFYQKNSNQ